MLHSMRVAASVNIELYRYCKRLKRVLIFNFKTADAIPTINRQRDRDDNIYLSYVFLPASNTANRLIPATDIVAGI